MTATNDTTARRCSECGQPLLPITGRGRPRMTCADTDSPDGLCRTRRKNRLDQARRDHIFVAAHTDPWIVPGAVGVADVMVEYDGEAPRDLAAILGDAGFHITSPTGTAYTLARSTWEDGQRLRRRLQAAAEATWTRREPTALDVTDEERERLLREGVRRRLDRARRNPA